MSDTMRVQPFNILLKRILGELEHNGSIFGIPRSLFYIPKAGAPFVVPDLFGEYLATPVGPAAGPHTQLAQNIISAWLSGGRFIELKTVQIMDELEIPRPCIDMEDEGYNVEWSQELKLEESAREYVHAWALIHLLHRLLGFGGPVGTIFNMSVGYNLAGIQALPMQRFMDRMTDASQDLAQLDLTTSQSPIPSRITTSVTLSTMHGCPPDEIERIALHLLEERRLHTIVKLNPTLLGKDAVLRILHDDLGYRDIQIPDAVFEHDLQYGRAVELIRTLKRRAAERGLYFGVKLSNTLAMSNHKGTLPGGEMYMSGRALYPITVNLFLKLLQEFDGDLNVSYAGGADALNVTTLLSSGALPVTAASDLLKPGGYSRLFHWLEMLEAEMHARSAASLDELARDRLANLERATAEALAHPRYKRSYFPFGLPKVESALGAFDCIAAPCVEQCAVCQDVPEYAWLIAQGDYDRALEVILQRNPLPGVTGYVCTHLCQTRCTRSNYDEPVGIRNLKRFAAEQARVGKPLDRGPVPQSADVPPASIAIIGSGPSGLAAAYYLALNGLKVTIFEERESPGGMPFIAPRFRLPWAIVQADVDRIAALGVDIRLNQRVGVAPAELLNQGYDAVYVACGFQNDAALEIEGIRGSGVYPALRLLEQVARGERPDLGTRVLVVGGGNTAMDAARTAQRLTGQPATVVYRRTRSEMPAEPEELRDLFEEGSRLVELATPRRAIRQDGRLIALECLRNTLGEPGPDGRRRPVPVPGSEFVIEADSIVLAIGQQPDLAFLAGAGIAVRHDGTIVTGAGGRIPVPEPIFAGGDVTRGPETIIAACADGRRAAEAICQELGHEFHERGSNVPVIRGKTSSGERLVGLTEQDIVRVKHARACRSEPHAAARLPLSQRTGFDLVEDTLTEEAARAEAARCLQCSTVCDKCVEVCPNRANFTYLIEPVDWRLPVLACQDGKLEVQGWEQFSVAQPRQIVHVDDFCNECGNCTTFCVHPGRPYTDKPRLFLERADFEREEQNAFYIQGKTICRREGGREARLTLRDREIVFESVHVRLALGKSETGRWEPRELVLLEPFKGPLSLVGAAEMAALLRGIQLSLPFLLVQL